MECFGHCLILRSDTLSEWIETLAHVHFSNSRPEWLIHIVPRGYWYLKTSVYVLS